MAFTHTNSSKELLLGKQKDITFSTSVECFASDGKRVSEGENFVPGPDNCIVCKCEKGEARFCRAALCQPPKDCKSFRIGDSCCDFICLDDILPPVHKDAKDIGSSSDVVSRIVVSAITAILSLALVLFLFHRLRQRKLRTAQHQYFEDQLDASGGFAPEPYQTNTCCHGAIYLSGNDHVDLFLDGQTPPFSPWKPPPYYFQGGDAPPPYSEVVANDMARLDGPLPSLNPLMIQVNFSQESATVENSGSVATVKSTLQGPQPRENLVPAGTGGRVFRENTGQSSSSQNTSLMSDQTYEASGENGTGAMFIPSDGQLANHLNDLNKGTKDSIPSAEVSGRLKMDSPSSPQNETNCSCTNPHEIEKCNNACFISVQQVSSEDKQPTLRPRFKYQHHSAATDAVIEELQKHLQEDACAMSTQETSSVVCDSLSHSLDLTCVKDN